MKKRALVVCLCTLFVIEAIALVVFATQKTESPQDAVAVNEVAESVRMDWHAMEKHKNRTGLDYVVLDADRTVRYRTKTGLSESINEAVMHRDTILDVEVNHEVVGKLIVYNDSTRNLQLQKQKIIVGLLIVLFLQFGICVAYIIYLDRTVIAPFDKLKGFAKRIADGNLDIPLEMDRQNLFGAFTESFDIMRSELKKARKAEAEANAGKKELVAKSLTFRCPLNKSCNIHYFACGRNYSSWMHYLSQFCESLIGNCYHTNIRLYCTERKISCLRLGA